MDTIYSTIQRLYAVVLYNLGTLNAPKGLHVRGERVPYSDVRSGIFI